MSKQETTADSQLRSALSEFYPRHAMLLQLSLTYLDTAANGMVLTTSIQAPAQVLTYGADGKQPAQLSIAGVVLNDQGRPAAGFKTDLKPNPASSTRREQNLPEIIYNHPSPLKPGIYQVPVAARDARSGIVGSAMHWIVVPDLSMRQLSLSSLILGLETISGKSAETGRMQWSVDKRFAHGSHLRFMTFIYNAATAAAATDLAAQVQVYKAAKP